MIPVVVCPSSQLTGSDNIDGSCEITLPALVLIWDTSTLSPTIFELWTSVKVQNGPYGCCLACPSGVLDDIDIWGQLGPILVSIGPDPVSVNLGRFEFLRRTVPGTPVEPSQTRKNKQKIGVTHHF